jgi:hypothetical protein
MFTVTGVHTRPNKTVTFFRESSPLAMWDVARLQKLQNNAGGFIGRSVMVGHDGLSLTTTAMWSSKAARDGFHRKHRRFLARFGAAVRSFNNATSSAVAFTDAPAPIA